MIPVNAYLNHVRTPCVVPAYHHIYFTDRSNTTGQVCLDKSMLRASRTLQSNTYWSVAGGLDRKTSVTRVKSIVFKSEYSEARDAIQTCMRLRTFNVAAEAWVFFHSGKLHLSVVGPPWLYALYYVYEPFKGELIFVKTVKLP